jgi:hypothetical protein
MASGVWGRAQQLLREAADIIEQRSAGRDETGRPDTIALAALSEGLPESTVLASMIGIKRIRLSRGHDHDSAIDLLAYEARRMASQVPEPEVHHAVEAPMPPVLEIPDDEDMGLKHGEAIACRTGACDD